MITALIVALCALTALHPPLPRRSTPVNLQYIRGYLINELPFLGLWWLLSGTLATLTRIHVHSLVWWLAVVFTALDVLVLARLALRARSARPVLSEALETAFGADAGPRYTRAPWWRILLLPFVSWRPDVRRIRNQRYGQAPRGNRLDVYVSRRGSQPGAPVLVYLHGGAFRFGSKMLGAHPMLYRLAAKGWVCISADYRQLRAGYADQLADVHAVLAWARANAERHGGSPVALFIAGGSAGANLAASAAMSDAGVRGVITLYGYYGPVGEQESGPARSAVPDGARRLGHAGPARRRPQVRSRAPRRVQAARRVRGTAWHPAQLRLLPLTAIPLDHRRHRPLRGAHGLRQQAAPRHPQTEEQQLKSAAPSKHMESTGQVKAAMRVRGRGRSRATVNRTRWLVGAAALVSIGAEIAARRMGLNIVWVPRTVSQTVALAALIAPWTALALRAWRIRSHRSRTPS